LFYINSFYYSQGNKPAYLKKRFFALYNQHHELVIHYDRVFGLAPPVKQQSQKM